MPDLNDRTSVRAEYASERGLLARRAAYRDSTGPDPLEMLFQVIAQRKPSSMLDVGSGPGELAERVQLELGTKVVGADISPRMAQLATDRGIYSLVGDAQALPLRDKQFDCVVAAWMLYHVQDINQALSEIRRVLRPGGFIVVVTNCRDHLAEARAAAGLAAPEAGSFPGEDAPDILQKHFADVELLDAGGTLQFPDRESLLSFVSAWQTFRGDPTVSDDLDFPLVVRRHPVILTAESR